MTLPWQMFSLVLFFSRFLFFFLINQISISLQNGDNFLYVIILQRRFFFISHALWCFTSYTCYPLLFPSLKDAEKELRKICTLETTNENNNKKIITTVKSLYILFPHTTKYFWLANFSCGAPIKVHFCYIMHIRLHCCKTNDSSFTWKFCFPNTNHEIFSKEFSFGHFLIHAFICTCRELDLKENIPKSVIS